MHSKRDKRVFGVALVSAVVIVAPLLFTPVLGNLWSLLTDGPMGDGSFELPAESSVFTFRVTEMNDGSGGWWVYAEDGRNFYAGATREGVRYIAFPKAKVAQCQSFEARDSDTWCREFAVMHKSE